MNTRNKINRTATAIMMVSIAMGIFFTSCKKGINNDLIETSNTEFNSSNLIEFSNSFIKKNEKGLNKIDKTKATKLAIIDALGGAGAAGGGPFVALWGGFLASLGAEPYVRTSVSPPVNAGSDVGNGFDPIGNYHNALLFSALQDNISAEVINYEINQECKDLLLSQNFYELNSQLIFANHQNTLVNIIDIINSSWINNQDFDVEQIKTSLLLTDNENSIIDIINTSVDELDISDISTYLLGVQDLIDEDTSLSLTEKNSLRIYLSILNSSMYFWNINS